MAFFADLAVSPNPNSGDYSITSDLYGSAYKLLEWQSGGAATNLGSMSATYSITGKAPGVYYYKLSHTNTQCSGWPEPECTTYTLYSETVSATVDPPPPPPIPTGLTGPGTDYNGSFTISWNASSGANLYRLEQKIGSGNWVLLYSGSGLSKAVSGASAGTYRYRVKACISVSNCSNWSSTYTMTVAPAPSVPSGLTGPGTDYNGAYTISWSSAANSSSYKLQEKVGSGSWSQIYSGGSLSRAISGKSAGSYSYRVRGCNPESICGNWSSTKVVTVEAAPATPGGLSGPGTDYNGSYTVSWNASARSTSYTLQQKAGSGSWAQVYAGASLSKAIAGNNAGTYSYRVRGCNVESVCSGWSSTEAVTVAPAPSTPAGLTGPATNYTGAYTISWNAAANASSYRLERKIDSGSWSQVYSGAAQSSAESSLSPASYSYRVKGCNVESVCSSWSSTHVVTVAPLPSAPTGLTGPDNSNTGIYTISWNSVSGASTYRLEEKLDGGSWNQVHVGSATSDGQNVQVNGTYTYRVRSCTSTSDCGGWSASHAVEVYIPLPGDEDPFPSPGAFAPPDDSDFPDAAILAPSVPPGDVGVNSVGAVRGTGGVSGGQAAYSIPVVVPPGRKGMQPALELRYSSSAGNGTAGIGWSLSGVSAIKRCAATAAQDGFTASVHYDAVRDRLCLDGMRLMVVGGTYGVSGAEYRTELDIFARIRQYGAINSSTSYFEIEYKNGRTGKFGSNADSRHAAYGRAEIMSWAIAEEQDPSGNTITYAYYHPGDGEHLIDAIHYTGTNGSNGDRHVRFVYETRPDARTLYRAGGKVRVANRLKAIKTEYQSSVIREYTLDYGVNSASTGRSLLRGIQECAYLAGQQHCLPPTTFDWLEAPTQFVTERLQFFDPDNMLPGGNPAIVHADKRWLHEVMPHGDQNGDGVKDWTALFVNAEGEVTDTHAENLANCFRPSHSLAMTCLEADFNADGLTDSFRSNNQEFEFRFAGNTNWTSTGVKWGDHGPALGNRHDYPLAFADFNGDGWVDLAIKQSSQLWIYFHTQSLSSPYSNTERQKLLDYVPNSSGFSDVTHVQVYGDMDGNGTPDFVVARSPGAGEVPGLPIPEYVVQPASQPGGALTTTTRAISNLVDDPNVNAHFFHDINGDGLQDLVSLAPTTYELQYRANNGISFPGGWISLGITVPTRQGTYQAAPGEWETIVNPIMSMMVVMDYDGNGRQDILIADSVVASGCAETVQEPPLPTVWKCDNALYGEYDDANPYSNYWPINSQEQDDSVRNFVGVRFDENAGGSMIGSTFATNIVASATQTAVFDATGDGLPDVVTVLGCRRTSCEFNTETSGRPGTVQNAAYVEGAWINRNVGTATQTGAQQFEFEAYDLMNAAVDGLGNRHEWTFKPLSSDAYDRASTKFYETTHSYQAADPDYFHFASSMYVVAEHASSNGLGGLNSMLYRYRGAIYNNKGRGFQGFRSIVAEEDIYDDGHSLAATDKITRTDFHQKWPLSSLVEQACTWVGDGHGESADDNPGCVDVLGKTVTNGIRNAATAGGARFVAIDAQTTTRYDLSYPHGLLTTQVMDRSFDAAGNISYESRSHSDAWTINLMETTASYSLDWANWWLNKLDSRTVTHNPVSQRHPGSPAIVPGTDAVKTVTTTFTQYDTTHRLPGTTVVTANDTSLSRTVTSTYNGFGLPSATTTSGSGIAVPRSVTVTYSNDGTSPSTDGYFPFTTTNTLGHQAEQHTDPTHGQPVSAWDANALLTATSYDAFGRLSETTAPGQPTAYQRHFWCGGGTSCPSGVYVVKTYSAGQAETHAYMDAFSREVHSAAADFAGTGLVFESTSYDERGNTTFTSEPYNPSAGESGSAGTRFLSYDALGRLTSKEADQANGTVLQISYSHSGLTTSINAGGLIMHRIFDGLGQLVETQDAMGGITRYAYDGAGNPIVFQDPNAVLNSALPVITASYNALGHKQWVDDPNMGIKDFTYNALGEVLTELDANGDEVAMVYDGLGRMTDRLVNGYLVGKWHYDNPATHKGLGLLDFEDSQFQPDGSRLQKFYYYTSAGAGRKNLLQVTHRFYEDEDPNSFVDYDTAYFTDGYYGRPKGMRYPGGTSLAFSYNASGFLTQERDPIGGDIYRQITARDSRHQITASNLDNGQIDHAAAYYPATGQMQGILVQRNGTPVHDLYYEFDGFGNLSYQRTVYGGAQSSESFGYDALHRLSSSARTVNGSAQPAVTYGYDASGNLTSKSDYASSYTYHASRPNAVASVSLAGGGSASFNYDGNGNMTGGHNKTLDYDAFNKPVTITYGGLGIGFSYGADRLRYRQQSAAGVRTYYLDKQMEVVMDGAGTAYRHYLGAYAVLTKHGTLSDPAPALHYLHRDRLGSVATITDGGGALEARGFAPFGEPRDGDWALRTPPVLGRSITDRGFTDHEHLDDVELIHMNGRAYDYRLGRFLSVDPIIQAPGNSQSLNPYSYIMNNPLSGTDPSGYCSSGTRVKGADSATACHSVVLSRSSTARQQGTSTGSDNGAVASNSTASDIGQASREPDEINSQLVGDQGGDFAIVVSYPKNYDNFGSIAIDFNNLARAEIEMGSDFVDGILADLSASRDLANSSSLPYLQSSLNRFQERRSLWNAMSWYTPMWSVAYSVSFPKGVRYNDLSPFRASPLSTGGAKSADEAFHYTSRTAVQSIRTQGLRSGSYATPNGNLSPLQAQIDLALPPNRGLPGTVMRVDLSGLRQAGYEIPRVTRVSRKFRMPGGGYEIQFPYSIPPEFITVITP